MQIDQLSNGFYFANFFGPRFATHVDKPFDFGHPFTRKCLETECSRSIFSLR